MLLAVLAIHGIGIAGLSMLRPAAFDLARPLTVTLLTLPSMRAANADFDPPALPPPRPMAALAPPLVQMPEVVIAAPMARSGVTIDDPCLRTSADPAQAEADRRDCARRLQLPGQLRLDEGGNLVGDPAGAVREAPEDKDAAERIAERLDLNLKAQFGGPESHENPVDRERLPEIPVETWQRVETRSRDNAR